jgi:myo-inositol-1(or 4)-monophosphatase
MSQYLDDLEPIAREAGALLMGYFDQHIRIEYKGDVDLVTAADRASEKLIVERLRARWPQHGIVGEEGTRSDTGAHGYPVFCISIALARNDDQLEAGVLYDPTRDELFAAERGQGATLNGKPLHVSSTTRVADSILGTGFPSHKRHQNPNIHFYQQLTLRSHGVRRAGSAALDLGNVAAGRFDGFWEFNLNPWDTAAGVLIVQEAGGIVTRFDGSPFRLDSREVLASNGLIHDELLTNFQEIFAGRGLEELPSPVEYAKHRN